MMVETSAPLVCTLLLEALIRPTLYQLKIKCTLSSQVKLLLPTEDIMCLTVPSKVSKEAMYM